MRQLMEDEVQGDGEDGDADGDRVRARSLGDLRAAAADGPVVASTVVETRQDVPDTIHAAVGA
jgi:hypothetical protein